MSGLRPGAWRTISLVWLAKQRTRADHDRWLGLQAGEDPADPLEPHAVAGQPRAKTEEDEDPEGRATSSSSVAKGYALDAGLVEPVLSRSTDPRDPDRDPREG